MTHISGQPYSILGDPGVVSRDDAIFSGESLLLDVNFRPKIRDLTHIRRRRRGRRQVKKCVSMLV